MIVVCKNTFLRSVWGKIVVAKAPINWASKTDNYFFTYLRKTNPFFFFLLSLLSLSTPQCRQPNKSQPQRRRLRRLRWGSLVRQPSAPPLPSPTLRRKRRRPRRPRRQRLAVAVGRRRPWKKKVLRLKQKKRKK